MINPGYSPYMKKNDKQDYQNYPVILSKYIISLEDINIATDEICQSLIIYFSF